MFLLDGLAGKYCGNLWFGCFGRFTLPGEAKSMLRSPRPLWHVFACLLQMIWPCACKLVNSLLYASLAGSAHNLWGGNLCVTVRDPAAQVLANVSVTVTKIREGESVITTPIHARTDSDGKVCFFALLDGRYAMEQTFPGFLTATYQPIRVDILRPAILETTMLFGDVIELDISGIARVSGTLRYQGKPIVRARVCLYEASKVPVNCSYSDRMGQFAILVEPGAYIGEVMRGNAIVFKGPIAVPTAGTFRNLFPSDVSDLPQCGRFIAKVGKETTN